MPNAYDTPTHDEIAVGAYHVWERESRPSGRQKQHWTEAQRQLISFPRRLEPKPPLGENSIFAQNRGGATTQMASMTPRSGKRKKARQPRVLVIDDEPPATHMLGGLLRRHGYISAGENDSTKAVQMAHRFKPDIVLLDMHMPWMDGREVAEAFAADSVLRYVPLIFITHDPRDRNPSTDSIQILVKPFSIEDLFARIEEGLAREPLIQ
jgi:CheY-like chemotaxis protein